jgi:hypothetical protein
MKASAPWRPALPTISTTSLPYPKHGGVHLEQPDGAEGEALRTIRQATDKGAALTRELMTYAGHTRTEFKCQDPNEMIRELEN